LVLGLGVQWINLNTDRNPKPYPTPSTNPNPNTMRSTIGRLQSMGDVISSSD